MRPHRLAPVLLLGGCTVFGDGPFAGTWLFTYDLNASYSGDCAEDPPTAVYTGDSDVLVDIYTSSGDQVVVMLDQILAGTADGKNITASWDYSYSNSDGTYIETRKEKLEGTLSGGVLTGTVRYDEATQNGDDLYTCTTTVDFEARRIVSDRDDYLEN